MPKRREGPVKNRQTGYFFIDLYLGFFQDKKRVRYSLRTKDPEKAQWLWEREYRKLWREYYGEASPERPFKRCLNDVASEYINYARDIKKVKEWKTVKNRLRIVSECWGDIYLDEVNSDRLVQLDAHLRNLKPPRSHKTINHYMGTLKTMFYYAIRKKYYSGDNPVTEVKPYIVDGKRREYSPTELSRIIQAAERVEAEAWPHTMLQKYVKRIILLLLYTGMRPGEVINLRWENIKIDKIFLKRTETKQKREKVIPLTSGIKAVLDSLRGAEGEYVIPRRRDQRITSSQSTKTALKKMREKSGIHDFDFHSLRHTAASRLIAMGVDIVTVKELLGHSSIKTTEIYAHGSFERKKEAVGKLERGIKNLDQNVSRLANYGHVKRRSIL